MEITVVNNETGEVVRSLTDVNLVTKLKETQEADLYLDEIKTLPLALKYTEQTEGSLRLTLEKNAANGYQLDVSGGNLEGYLLKPKGENTLVRIVEGKSDNGRTSLKILMRREKKEDGESDEIGLEVFRGEASTES